MEQKDLESSKSLSVSETLLKTSRIAMFSAQIAGYLPLSVNYQFNKGSLTRSTPSRHRNGFLLRYSWKSFPTISSLIALFVIIGWTTLYYVVFKQKLRFVRIFGPTESFAYALLVVVGTGAGVFLRIRAFQKGVPEYFQEVLKLLQNFDDLGLKVSGLKEISKIQKYLRVSFLAYLVPLMIHCILVHAIRPVMDHHKYKKWAPDIVYSAGSGVWVFWSYLLISNLWIILFPRIYSACYKEISKDIIARFKTTKDTDENIKPWYMAEICKNRGKNRGQETQDFQGIYQAQDQDQEISLESRVGGYLELIIHLGKMIDRFNQVFGERLMLEMITCITFIILYSFFGCFWANRGEVRIIGEVVTPLYIHGKKILELGYSCGNISKEAQIAMKTLIDNVPFDKLSLGMCRKIRLIQIQIDSSPPTVSAKQFFTINRGSVTTVLSGMAGVLVALVQFRQGE